MEVRLGHGFSIRFRIANFRDGDYSFLLGADLLNPFYGIFYSRVAGRANRPPCGETVKHAPQFFKSRNAAGKRQESGFSFGRLHLKRALGAEDFVLEYLHAFHF